jgi:hypothetical protein
MPATIRELINANVLYTVQAIDTGTGFANSVTKAEWAKQRGNPPQFPDVNGIFVLLIDGGDEPRESSPISKDDYNATIYAEVYHVTPLSSEVEMQDKNASCWGDLKKALSADRNRGTHPTNGGPLAFHTRVETPIPMDTQQGVTVPITVWYRTAKEDPYSQ